MLLQTPTDRVIASSSSPAVAGPVCYAPYTLWMEAGFHMHAHNLRNICRGLCTLVHSLQRFSGWYVHGVNLMGKNHMDMFYMGNHMDMFYMGKNHMYMFYMGNHMDMFYMGNHMDMFYMGKNHMDMFYMGNHM